MPKLASNPEELPVKSFKTKEEWAVWLGRHHTARPGIWLCFAKRGSGAESVTYAEALDVALCYGWIDGQKKPRDAQSWMQKFVPRSARSIWSKINREKALALQERGELKPAGLAAIENAKRNGRWEAAYDSPSTSTVPADFEAALTKNAAAQEFFAALDKRNRYAFLWRIQNVRRAETRARKIEQFVDMLARKEKIHN